MVEIRILCLLENYLGAFSNNYIISEIIFPFLLGKIAGGGLAKRGKNTKEKGEPS